jgi:tetratricopeptide (TPR) repeat protein
MPSRLFLAILLLAASSRLALASSPDQWVEVRSPHFTVVTNSNEKQGRHVLDQFERMRWVFHTLYPNLDVDPPAPILVFAAKNTKTFQSLEPPAYLAKGQLNLAGYFLTTQDSNYVLVRLDAEQEQHPFATVYHEYTHLQFRKAGEYMPLWLNEGLAEFFQNTDFHDKNVTLGEPSADDILYLRQQSLIPLPVLFRVDARSPYYHEEQKGSVFYAESWALTHYLEITNKQKHTDTVDEYLKLMRNHEDPVAAAEKAFGNLKQLQSELEAYIRESRYQQFVLNSAAAPIDESTYTLRPLTSIEADADRAEILASVQREKEARDLVASILQDDPKNVHALEVMGNIELRAGNHEAARKWYGDAVKLDSKSYLANYYFASVSMQSEDGRDDPSIEPSLRAAIQLNPRFAPAYQLLAQYDTMRHTHPEEALSLIIQAVKLDPGNLYLRLNASNVLMSQARYADAVSVVQAAAGLARTPSELNMVQSRLQQVKDIQQAQANAEKSRQEYMAHQSQPDSSSVNVVHAVVPITEKPKHPSEASGPKHTLLGIIHGVTCSYPTVLEFHLEAPKSTVNVYNNDFTKIDLTAFGFTPKDTMNPCSDLDGRTARIQYAESTDKSVDGLVFAIELRK